MFVQKERTELWKTKQFTSSTTIMYSSMGTNNMHQLLEAIAIQVIPKNN